MYAVAERFVDVALRRDDSLFTPGRSIWSLPNLDELDQLYVQRPDLGGDSFEEKLQKQLDGGSADAYQLMAEVTFVFYLPARWNISAQTKRQRIEEVLSWSPDPVTLPGDLSDVLEHGIGSGGQGMLMYKWASLVFLLSFARRWKQASADVRQIALADPWKFREFVAQIPTDGGGIYGRESLLHLVFPDTFERIFSGRDKWRLTEQMKQLVDDPDANVDLKISQIRGKLSARFGSSFDFYDTDGVRALWKPMDSKLDEFIYWASKFHELGRFDAEERDYKLETTSRLTAARGALLADGDWLPLLRRAFAKPNNLTPWQAHDTFLKWCESDLSGATKLLRRIWDGEADPLERLGDFFAHFSKGVVSGMGSRTTIGSFFMLAIDPYLYPPYRVAATHAAYHLTGHEPGEEKDELSLYRAGLAFLDKLRERAAERGLELRDRLDAQSVLWAVTSWGVPGEWPAEDQTAFEKYRQGATEEDDEELIDEPEPPTDGVKERGPAYDPLIALADELLVDHESVTEIAELLKTKGQIIFYGPPGTGKTYIARKLAAALASGDATRVRLVQFHPSYSYEDFVEGYRPQTLDNGQPTFGLVHGPLRLLAQQAIEDAGRDYYLIVDEINRGNIAKVFGELYFLLEYRDEGIHLQYSPERPFRLPANLKIIGTMNTADRSIALMDAALRRRFTFVPFFPDQKPIEGVLGRWLKRHRSDMAWVSDVVDAANRELADRNGAIGPSFFMKTDLNQKRLELIWKHEIIPYLEDYYFDRPERVKAFALAALRKSLEAPETQPAIAAEAPSGDGVSEPGMPAEDQTVASDTS
jgi:hypothetical protein